MSRRVPRGIARLALVVIRSSLVILPGGCDPGEPLGREDGLAGLMSLVIFAVFARSASSSDSHHQIKSLMERTVFE